MYCKVCGINDHKNLEEILGLPIELIGLNFYVPSPRYTENIRIGQKNNIKLVGVFVNSPIEDILDKKNKFQLDFAQLHGDEGVEFCHEVDSYLPVIKVFRIDDEFDFDSTRDFGFCSYFLFDTKSVKYGGSGLKFNWNKLDEYRGDVPFFLSGGIAPEDARSISEFSHPSFAGVDINSKFEIKHGIKDAGLILTFINEIKS